MFNNTDINYKIFRGFTFAEVLITLGVIGVVSAITMPTLIQKHQEQRTIAQLQKVYSTFTVCKLTKFIKMGIVAN